MYTHYVSRLMMKQRNHLMDYEINRRYPTIKTYVLIFVSFSKVLIPFILKTLGETTEMNYDFLYYKKNYIWYNLYGRLIGLVANFSGFSIIIKTYVKSEVSDVVYMASTFFLTRLITLFWLLKGNVAIRLGNILRCTYLRRYQN